MSLSREWRTCGAREHRGLLRADASCECGITEQHEHCAECGRLYSVGTGEAIPMSHDLQRRLRRLARRVTLG